MTHWNRAKKNVIKYKRKSKDGVFILDERVELADLISNLSNIGINQVKFKSLYPQQLYLFLDSLDKNQYEYEKEVIQEEEIITVFW